MGEVIKRLGFFVHRRTPYTIELNSPVVSSEETQIHIQSDEFRLEMSRSEYIAFSCAVKLAAEKLRRYKCL